MFWDPDGKLSELFRESDQFQTVVFKIVMGYLTTPEQARQHTRQHAQQHTQHHARHRALQLRFCCFLLSLNPMKRREVRTIAYSFLCLLLLHAAQM